MSLVALGYDPLRLHHKTNIFPFLLEVSFLFIGKSDFSEILVFYCCINSTVSINECGAG